MPLRLTAVTFDVGHPREVAEFWAGLLVRESRGEPDGVLVPGDDTQVGLRFRPQSGKRSGTHRFHLHVTSTSLQDQQRTVDRAVNLGARHVDVGQLPDDGHVVLADPGANLFCVIEPHNDFLAGTGLLGEVTCEGSRTVGLFWRDALEWPLVWDRGAQTAIQSPLGGTKLSWDEEGMVSVPGTSGQRFDLAAEELAVDVDRVVALGATRIGETGGLIKLSDPDGNVFASARSEPTLLGVRSGAADRRHDFGERTSVAWARADTLHFAVPELAEAGSGFRPPNGFTLPDRQGMHANTCRHLIRCGIPSAVTSVPVSVAVRTEAYSGRRGGDPSGELGRSRGPQDVGRAAPRRPPCL